MVTVLGLALPVRATLTTVTVGLFLLLDHQGRVNGIVDSTVGPFGPSAVDQMRLQALGRHLPEGPGPLVVVVRPLRDGPAP